MLHETLKALRKQKGYSQEEVASRLNVVRQTVSKWEKGLSVPDADMLVKIAELYEVGVVSLLGGTAEPSENAGPHPDFSEIAVQLSRINEQLVIRNRRWRRVLKTVAIVLITLFALSLINILLSVTAFHAYSTDASTLVVETEVITTESRSVPQEK